MGNDAGGLVLVEYCDALILKGIDFIPKSLDLICPSLSCPSIHTDLLRHKVLGQH